VNRFGRSRLTALLARPDVRRVFEALDGDGEEVRIVGGALRNALVGREPGDVDFATTATPDVTRRRARRAGLAVVPTGIEHGTLTVLVDGTPFEVTTLREDVETDGRRAKVRFGRDFAADALRRDFTINALMADASGRIADHAGGIDDLAAGRVRFIGDADQRIREDYLRILRFFRFSADYAMGALDDAGLAASLRQREGLAMLSRERIRAELWKLTGTARAVEIVGLLVETGLWGRLTGGVAELGRFARAHAAGLAADERVAALAVMAEEDGQRLRERLRLSNEETDIMVSHARLAARMRSLGRPLDSAAARALAAEFDTGPLARTLAIVAGEALPDFTEDGRWAIAALAAGRMARPVFPLRGADLVAAGIGKGPDIGALLARARTVWSARGCPEGDGVREDLLAALGFDSRPRDP
jgi:poly(A) polymerase